jgi:hypothetical protein
VDGRADTGEPSTEDDSLRALGLCIHSCDGKEPQVGAASPEEAEIAESGRRQARTHRGMRGEVYATANADPRHGVWD